MIWNWVSIIATAIIIACAVVSVQIYYNEKMSSCISNPFGYGVTDLEKRTGYEFFASGKFITNGNTFSPTLYINSKGISIEPLVDSSNIINISLLNLSSKSYS